MSQNWISKWHLNIQNRFSTLISIYFDLRRCYLILYNSLGVVVIRGRILLLNQHHNPRKIRLKEIFAINLKIDFLHSMTRAEFSPKNRGIELENIHGK